MIEIYDSTNLPDLSTTSKILEFYERTIPCEFYSENDKNRWIDEREDIKNFLLKGACNKGAPNYEDSAKSIIALIDDGSNQIIGILENANFYSPFSKMNVLFISWLLINKENRGKGFASILYSEYLKLIQPLLNSGLYDIHKLNVNIENPAIEIYRKWGYKESNDINDAGIVSMLKKA